MSEQKPIQDQHGHAPSETGDCSRSRAAPGSVPRLAVQIQCLQKAIRDHDWADVEYHAMAVEIAAKQALDVLKEISLFEGSTLWPQSETVETMAKIAKSAHRIHSPNAPVLARKPAPSDSDS